MCLPVFAGLFSLSRQTYLQVVEKLGKEGDGKMHFCAAIFEYVAFVFFVCKCLSCFSLTLEIGRKLCLFCGSLFEVVKVMC